MAGQPGFNSRLMQDRSPCISVLIGSEAHRSSQPMGTGGPFPEHKKAGYEANYLSTSSAEVKNCGALPPVYKLAIVYRLL
jgi:hypothetical protein